MAKKTRPVVVLDVETRLLSTEVGGWNNCDRMGVSVAVLYDEETEEYEVYTQDEVGKLVAKLTSRPVVGFNLERFDYPVLWGALRTIPRLPIDAAPMINMPATEWPKEIMTFDLLQYIRRATGSFVSLDSLATAMLDSHKSGDGLQAVQMWNAGMVDALVEYCKKDVELTYKLWQWGVEHGTVWYFARNGKVKHGAALWQADHAVMLR